MNEASPLPVPQCEYAIIQACACTRVWVIRFNYVTVTASPKLLVSCRAICNNLLLLTVTLSLKWKDASPQGFPFTWKWKILRVTAVRLHLPSQTVLLTFPIGVDFIALAFGGKAIQILLARSWTEGGGKKMNSDHYHCFYDNINVDTQESKGAPFIEVLINNGKKETACGE